MGGPRFRFEDKGGEVYYAEEGFLAIQHAIAVAYVKLQSEQNIPKIVLGVGYFCQSVKLKYLETKFLFSSIIYRDFHIPPTSLMPPQAFSNS